MDWAISVLATPSTPNSLLLGQMLISLSASLIELMNNSLKVEVNLPGSLLLQTLYKYIQGKCRYHNVHI